MGKRKSEALAAKKAKRDAVADHRTQMAQQAPHGEPVTNAACEPVAEELAM